MLTGLEVEHVQHDATVPAVSGVQNEGHVTGLVEHFADLDEVSVLPDELHPYLLYVSDVDLDALGEHLYQISLGKAPPSEVDAMVDIATQLWPSVPVGAAASYAIALAELRLDLARAEDNRHVHAATGLKRKIDLFEDLFLRCLEQFRAVNEANSKIGAKNKTVHLHAGEEMATANEPDLVDMIKTSYTKVGGHPKIKAVGDLSSEYSDWIVLDIDEDPEADLGVFGNPNKKGMKLGAAATDGTSNAKLALQNLKQQLLTNGWWAEVSDAPAHIAMNKLGLKPIENEQYVRELLAGKEIEWHGEHPEGKFPGTFGWYTRKIGGEPHAKIIVGDV